MADCTAALEQLPKRLADAVVKQGDCWVVSRFLNGNGYARISIDGKRVYAHRLAYERLVGPIGQDEVVDHLCRERACINPAHMELVSNAVNILRGESPPALNARKARCPQGHEYRVGADGTRRCMVCRRLARIARGEQGVLPPPSDRTHCPHGHAYDETNTYLVRRPDGSIKQRMCRECSRQRTRAWRATSSQGR